MLASQVDRIPPTCSFFTMFYPTRVHLQDVHVLDSIRAGQCDALVSLASIARVGGDFARGDEGVLYELLVSSAVPEETAE